MKGDTVLRRLILAGVLLALALATAVAVRAGGSGGDLDSWTFRRTNPHPGVAYLAALPPCGDDPAFTTWATAALRTYGGKVFPAAAMASAPASTVMGSTPVLRLPVPADACFAARRSGAVHGWYVLSADSGLIARGVSAPHGRDMPQAVLDHARSGYIEDRVGSGQAFAGSVIGRSVAGIGEDRLTVVEFPGWNSDGPAPTLPEVQRSLHYGAFVPPWERHFLPQVLPGGYDLCGIATRIDVRSVGTAFRAWEFCAPGRPSILMGLLDPAEGDPSTPMTFDGQAARTYELGGRRGAFFAPDPDQAQRFWWIEAPASTSAAQLMRILRSMPIAERAG